MKGKYFFFESDIKGFVLKFDNIGKVILTVSFCWYDFKLLYIDKVFLNMIFCYNN